jgi:hypothetical protein
MSEIKLKQLSVGKQRRLDTLMSHNNNGRLTQDEVRELRELVGETEEITIENARGLAERR